MNNYFFLFPFNFSFFYIYYLKVKNPTIRFRFSKLCLVMYFLEFVAIFIIGQDGFSFKQSLPFCSWIVVMDPTTICAPGPGWFIHHYHLSYTSSIQDPNWYCTYNIKYLLCCMAFSIYWEVDAIHSNLTILLLWWLMNKIKRWESPKLVKSLRWNRILWNVPSTTIQSFSPAGMTVSRTATRDKDMPILMFSPLNYSKKKNKNPYYQCFNLGITATRKIKTLSILTLRSFLYRFLKSLLKSEKQKHKNSSNFIFHSLKRKL